MRTALLLLLICAQATGATFYCGPSGSGSANGSNFSNLLAMPTTTGFNRGDTYVLIDGSYGSKTLSTATSSTTTITIRKANSSDSGVTGYNANLHDGQATFGTVTFRTQYWIFDGITRTETNGWATPAGYGFKATQIRSSSIDGDDGDNSIVRYVDAGDDYSLTYTGGGEAFYLFGQDNFTVSRCAAHMSIHALMQASAADGLIVEYTNFGPGWGKEAIRGGNGGGSNWIIRHNRFWNSSQIDPEDGTSGITAEIDIFGDDGSGAYANNVFYGNWFSNEHSGGRNSCLAVGGQGFTGTASNCLAYNNTFAGIEEASVFAMVLLSGSGNVARNNLFYDCTDTDVSANTTSDNDLAGGDPFVSYATFDLRLSGATSAGFSLSAPYDTDPLGNTRGGDGTWDVGAFEYEDGEPEPGGGNGTATTINATNLNNN